MWAKGFGPHGKAVDSSPRHETSESVCIFYSVLKIWCSFDKSREFPRQKCPVGHLKQCALFLIQAGMTPEVEAGPLSTTVFWDAVVKPVVLCQLHVSIRSLL